MIHAAYLGTGNGVTTFPLVAWIISLNGIVWGGTLAVMGIMLSITLGYTIAKSYDVNKVAGAIVSLAAYLMGLPQSASTSTTITLSDVLPSNIADMIQASGALATATISYFATIWGLVSLVVISVPWVMPVFLSGFLATAGDWRSLVLTAVNMAVAFAIWAPFIIAANGVDSPSDN